ncbi:MAG: 16S rRNA (cytosine(1402)-N(4))-methyltransferase RsmH [Eubacteriales bacterium]|nr:16S rRNA (cytosine(1402)-N(4))-methyltransferase RsmH [Eubacteriales bacterium]MDD3882377.1 16S rRNA (cytosine(1402)-N(4))-methyltransferase RsmH [Eubacteriales bacterium]MDD4512402.1 16S rRNA (cytosine(1402)-N(4))-methyltransferase RsmH [Eubacteriales bacterium]
MEFHHIPVMLNEVLENLAPFSGGVYADGTLGAGGHSEAILAAAGDGARLFGIDRDEDALSAATKRLSRFSGFTAIHGNFHDVKQLLKTAGAPLLDGGLLDLGVSSYQLDEKSRGFSYHEDAPLDMRMDRSCGITAAEMLNTYSEDEIKRILWEYGEEKWAARIAKVLVEIRKEKPLERTLDFVDVIDRAVPKAVRQKQEGHPARRSFQAVRIAVNDELEPLKAALESWMDCIKPGGRLAVITFHSLEDRIVKQTFRKMQFPCICSPKAPICTCGRKPVARCIGGAIKPSKEEVEENPRSRSAILRVAEKLMPEET